MPELPEVETIRADLAPLLKGRTILRVAVSLADPHYQGLEEAVGRTINELRRRGKYLIADLGDRELILHLGMTGQLGVRQDVPSELRHVHVRFWLEHGDVLFLNDPRRFGRLNVVKPGDYAGIPTLASMGPEPLGADFDLAAFTLRVARVRSIKAGLLSQRIVAGVGNIYADEALFQARLHPEQGELTGVQAQDLHQAIRSVLSQGVRNRGTTLQDYRDGMGRFGANQQFLSVFERAGEPCHVCRTSILKTRVAGRGTYFCPSCQVRTLPLVTAKS